nr:SDR family NAD(P)-dependent oxidoreductase [Williamsia sp. D3]
MAVVTGGSRGIGAAISRRLAADGFAVAVNYSSSAPQAHEVVESIVDRGGRATAIKADVSDAAAAAELISEATRTLGPPVVLVNNAGINVTRLARSMSPADWDRVIAVNLSGAFYCTHAALPAMYDRGWGRMVFVSSPAAERRPSPGTGAYAIGPRSPPNPWLPWCLSWLARMEATYRARRSASGSAALPVYDFCLVLRRRGRFS